LSRGLRIELRDARELLRYRAGLTTRHRCASLVLWSKNSAIYFYVMEPAHITIDATGKSMGRLATQVARVLLGKHTPEYKRNLQQVCPLVSIEHIDAVRFTGKKLSQKVYRYHTGYMGHLKEIKVKALFAAKPSAVFMHTIRGMLPKNNQRDKLLKNIIFT